MHKRIPDCLVLNKGWIPIHIVSWQKAISLIYQEKCKALDKDYLSYAYDDWKAFSIANAKNYHILHNINYPLALPEIIVSISFDRLPDRQVKYSRQNIFARDKFRCMYCGKQFQRKELTLDHVYPKSKGGRTTWSNTVSSCYSCNQKKANLTLEEAHMRLKFKPKKPKWFSPLDGVNVKTHPCKSWKHFMDRVSKSV